MPKVLITDNVAAEGIDLLKNSTVPVDVKRGLSPDELIADHPRSMTPWWCAARPGSPSRSSPPAANLKVVARAGIGVDNIDLDAATRAGVAVVNAPIGNTVAAAEHTVALMLALARNVPQAYASMKEGQWQRSAFMGIEVRNKTWASSAWVASAPRSPAAPPASGCGWWPTTPSSLPTSPPAWACR